MCSEGVAVTRTAAKRVLSRWDLATQIIVQRRRAGVSICDIGHM